VEIPALRLVLLNSIIALAAVVPAAALTVYLESIGFFSGEQGDGDFVGSLNAMLTFAVPSLGLLAASGIAYGVLVVIVGHLVPVNRLIALVMVPLAAVPLGIQLWPNVVTPTSVALLGSYCLMLGLFVRTPPNSLRNRASG
jgi:hypothetical protein